MAIEENEAVVHRFYDELWNCWRLEVADEIVSETLEFRGSLGQRTHGREAFKAYVETVQRAFPDWHNQVEEIVAADDRVVTRMTWTGTHRGRLDDIEPTGLRVEYCGAAFFRLRVGVIEEAWVVGDTDSLWRTIRDRGSLR
jgi:predicted ester cyclase